MPEVKVSKPIELKQACKKNLDGKINLIKLKRVLKKDFGFVADSDCESESEPSESEQSDESDQENAEEIKQEMPQQIVEITTFADFENQLRTWRSKLNNLELEKLFEELKNPEDEFDQPTKLSILQYAGF